EGPALVHCASGNRVGALAALRAAWLQGADEEAAIAEGRRWGLRSLETEVRSSLARERCVASANGQDEAAACHGSCPPDPPALLPPPLAGEGWGGGQQIAA